MEKLTTKRLKITSKGQMTVPASWRRKNGEPVEIDFIDNGSTFEVRPVLKEEMWETVYQSPQDGPPIPIDDFITMLEESINNDR